MLQVDATVLKNFAQVYRPAVKVGMQLKLRYQGIQRAWEFWANGIGEKSSRDTPDIRQPRLAVHIK